MATNLLILRLLHICFGAFWVGTDVFLTFLLLPGLRTLGPDIERKVIAALMRLMPPALMISSLVTFVSGIFMTGIMRGWNFNGIFANGWSTSIFIGFVGTVITLIVGFGVVPPLTIRADRMERSFVGRQPAVAELAVFDNLKVQTMRFAKLNTVLLIVVVIFMVLARFV